jgi:DNA polymerase-1
MELTGIYVDRAVLETLGQEWDEELERLTRQAHELAGHPFNLNSPQQVAQVLFTELGLPILRKTPKGQPATDEETLSALAPQHPLPEVLLQYREIHKLRTTYISSLIESIHPRTGRVHTVFQQAVAATGRLSSQSPNLQNIPIHTERGKRLRQAFSTPKAGYALLSADYSQIELRIAAALSGDPQMIQDFLEGRDIHSATAQRLFGTPDITPEMRRIAKTVNFGIIYGITAHGLAERLGHISRTEAQKLIDQYFARYPGIKSYIEAQIARVRETGYAETLLGRRRYIPNIHSSNKTLRAEAERLAINTPIQGTAADLIKVAMIRLHGASLPPEAHLLLQIHDELLWEIPKNLIPDIAPTIAKIMSEALTLPRQVPIEVELKVGPNWLQMEPLKTHSQA